MTDTTYTRRLDGMDDIARLAKLERVANLMDSALRIPGTRIRVGLDSIVGLVPGVGDTLALAPGAWIIGSAWNMGAPNHVLGRMALNSGIDWAIGTIPLIGDLFDVGFKANIRNVALLREHVEKTKGRPDGRPLTVDTSAVQPTSSIPAKK